MRIVALTTGCGHANTWPHQSTPAPFVWFLSPVAYKTGANLVHHALDASSVRALYSLQLRLRSGGWVDDVIDDILLVGNQFAECLDLWKYLAHHHCCNRARVCRATWALVGRALDACRKIC